MGSGASNQVRARSDSATKVEQVCSPSFTADYSRRFKPATNENILFASNRSVANSQSEIMAHVSNKPFKGQKSQIRSEPPFGLRKHSGETEARFDNTSKHELHQKIKELELALAVSDSQKLDLQDQLQALEDRATITVDKNAATPTNISNTLHETLNVKDQHIKKLEAELNRAQAEFQKKTIKLKKHIQGLKKQICELRHEALITQMELKIQTNDSAENQSNATSSNETKEMSVLGAESNSGHTRIIVELSSQISEQEEQITSLKAEVAEKNKQIKELEAVVRDIKSRTSAVPVDPMSMCSENSSKDIANTERVISTMGEKHESYFGHPKQKSHFQRADVMLAHTKSHNGCPADSHIRSIFKHQTTSLSDSDSDWDEGHCLSQRNRHSAPARSRIKSQMNIDSPTPHTSNIRSKTDGNLKNVDNYLGNSLAVLNTVTSNNLFETKEQI